MKLRNKSSRRVKMTKQNFSLGENGKLAELFEILRHRHEEKEQEQERSYDEQMREDALDIIEILCEKAAEAMHVALTPASHSFTAPAPCCH